MALELTTLPDASPAAQPPDSTNPYAPHSSIAHRDRWGNWLPGHSGNPGGRSRPRLADAIADRTMGGVELVDYALTVLRDPEEQTPLRLQALSWLANRLWGKPKETVEVTEVQRQLKIIIDARDPQDALTNT